MIALKPLGCIILAFFLCIPQRYCYAQDNPKVTYGKVAAADFVLPHSSLFDSSTQAVILSDIGSIHFEGNKQGWFSYVYQRTTRIRLLKRSAFSLATVELSLYTPGEESDKLTNLAAATFNQENGQVMATKLDPKDIFTEKEGRDFTHTKFSMPAVKEGSVIEYTYTITSSFIRDLPSWKFQSINYPCLWSECSVEIPQTLMYIFVRQGVHPFAVDKGKDGHQIYRLTRKVEVMGAPEEELSVSANTIKHDWVMKEIPPFQAEHYLTTPANYIDKIDFQLSKTYNGEDFHDVSNSWANVTDRLLKADYFGLPLSDEEAVWLSDYISKELPNLGGNDLSRARTIYYYVNSHFSCTNTNDIYINTTLRDVVKKNSGTVGEINLLLAAMLRRSGLHADPVLLSTREHGFNLASYPVLQRLNYVIVRLKTDKKIYYLDAASPELGFGQLTNDCYNGHARIICNEDSASIYFDADSLHESSTTLVLMSAGEKGLEGECQQTLGMQESYSLRQKVKKTGEEAYFKNLQTAYGDDITLSQTGIDSLQLPEDPAKVHFHFAFNQGADAPVIYLNPFSFGELRTNPFKAAERKYPVEMPYVIDEMYVFSMEIPKGYTVSELPKSARVAYNGDQGSFEYLIGNQGGTIQLNCHLKLLKAWFPPDDYGTLRDFFGFIVNKENEQIVLKKNQSLIH